MNKFIIFIFTMLAITNMNAQKLTETYRIVSSEYKTQGEELVIQNMPKVRSQDSVGLCYAFSSATLLQKFWCDDLKVSDCAGVQSRETISPVAISGLKIPINGKTNAADRETFAHAFLEGSTGSGGSGSALLRHASLNHSFCAESNFPFDQFVGKNNFSNMDRVAAAKAMEKLADENITKLKNIYDQRKTEAVAVEACPECLNAVNTVIPVNMNNRINPVENGLAKGSFQEFVFESYFRSCNPKVKLIQPTYGEYPTTDTAVDAKKFIEDSNHPAKMAYMNQIKKVLSNKVPLQISGFCAATAEDKSCAGSHTTVISGYKTVCKPSGGQCVDLIKIHNSYGSEWQEKHNDGWVVANDILNSIVSVKSNNKVVLGSLSWITDGPLK